MQCRILGGISGCGPDDGGYGVAMRGQLAVMTAELVGAHPAAVPVDRLIWALWRDAAPTSARSGIQAVASKLRRRFGRSTVRFASDAYQLALEPSQIDACVFEREAAAARAHLAAGDSQAALAAAEVALALWLGPPFGALRDSLDLDGFILGLENTRARTQEIRVRGLLGLQRVDVAADLAAELVHAEPFREQRWRDLMVALYQSGRTAEALAAYQRLRTLLAHELGIEPQGDTRELEGAILRQDDVIGVASYPGSPMSSFQSSG